MNGTDLKIARIRAGLKGIEIAAEMGISPSRVTAIERPTNNVTERMAMRYLEAIARCRTPGGKVA